MSTDQHIDHRPAGPPATGAPPTAEPGVPGPRAVPWSETILGLDRRSGAQSLTEHTSDQHASAGTSAVVAEKALLGVMLVLPDTVGQVGSFLGVRDFSTREARAAYAALRGLHQVGALIDLRAVAPHLRWDAAHENQLRLFAALTMPGSPHHARDLTDPAALVDTITTAAPVDGMSLRGVFDPAAAVRLGRIVLEDSCRRQLAAAGVSMRRSTPLVPSTQSAPTRDQRRTHALLDNLTRVHQHLDILAQRLARAVHQEHHHARRPGARPTPPQPHGTAPTASAETPSPAVTPRSWAEPVARVLRRRAERHLIHLALHAGHLTDLPAEVVDLAAIPLTDPRHASTWTAIQELKAAGQPVNYVTVLHHLHTTNQTGPVLSDRALIAMAAPPATSPARIARSLRTLATGALRDITAHADVALAAAAVDRRTPLADAIAGARRDIHDLTGQARTALAAQQAAHQHATRPTDTPPARGRRHAT